jgi:hypothetical protein
MQMSVIYGNQVDWDYASALDKSLRVLQNDMKEPLGGQRRNAAELRMDVHTARVQALMAEHSSHGAQEYEGRSQA